MINYPTEMPVQEVKALVQSIKTQSFTPDTLREAWIVLGYALSFTDLSGGFASQRPLSENECCSALESAAQPQEGMSKIDWSALIPAIIAIIQKIITK